MGRSAPKNSANGRPSAVSRTSPGRSAGTALFVTTHRPASGRASNGSNLSSAYLVPDLRQEEFLAAASEAITALETRGCEAVLRGPLPPYSFVDVRLEVAGYG